MYEAAQRKAGRRKDDDEDEVFGLMQRNDWFSDDDLRSFESGLISTQLQNENGDGKRLRTTSRNNSMAPKIRPSLESSTPKNTSSQCVCL